MGSDEDWRHVDKKWKLNLGLLDWECLVLSAHGLGSNERSPATLGPFPTLEGSAFP